MAVQSGYVESVRAVQIEGTKTGIGAASGAALGGVAGSAIGHSTRSHALGAIGGVVLGGLGGAAVEEATTQRAGCRGTARGKSGT